MDRKILVHGYMKYRCKDCKKSWKMWLEKGIEDRREYKKTGKHKPSPFVIKCPYCGGMARDISGIIPLSNYMPLQPNMHRFENKNDSDCGIVVFGKLEE